MAKPFLLDAGAVMNDKFLAVLLVAMLPGLSFAQGSQNYLCTYGDLQRRVEIVYETGVVLPCEVHYYKDSESPGDMQVLWRAMNEAGYCEAKTQEFVTRLKALGWSCAANDDVAISAEPEPMAEPEPATDEEESADDQ